MLQFRFGKNEAGYPVTLVTQQEPMDALKLLRAMKNAFPEVWAQVNLEIVVPQKGANGVNRILDAEGKAS